MLIIDDYFMSVTSYEMGEVSFHLIGGNGFHIKAENEGFSPVGSRCHQNIKYENFRSSFSRLRQKNCIRKLAGRTARFFVFLICNVDVSSCRRGFIKSLLFQRGQAKIAKKNNSRELKETRRRRKRERHLKM